jgi:hypothetical protein
MVSEYGSNEVTQKEFAALRGVSEPMVSRWKSRGRLVMSDDGLRVRVDESVALLERTLDPARGGDRTGKPAARPALPPPASAARTSGGDRGGDYHDAAADEKRERAAILRLERLELEGKLVFRDQVEREAQTRSMQARDALVAMSDRLAPLLAAEVDVDKVRALLDAEVRHVCAQLSVRSSPAQAAE